jgi:RNA polymerase sigma-70 factor (ECF subfamily)
MIDLSVESGRLPDTEAIARIMAGETALFELIIRRYNGYLYKVGRSYGFTHADTEDLMQETYLNAFIHLPQFAHRATFKTWLIRIMLNQCYHAKKKANIREQAFQAMQMDTHVKSSLMPNGRHTDTGAAIMNRELKNILEDAILHIPERYREVFTLRELNGLSIRETATALNISEVNVKVRLNRARHMLRSRVEKFYDPEDLFSFNLIYCDAMVTRVMARIQEVIDGKK